MSNETKAKIEAAIITAYILMTGTLGIIVFARFILALILNP